MRSGPENVTTGAKGWRRGEGGRAGYAPYNATPERNHWLGTATGSLPPHEAPRFGRLRLPQLGAGGSRNGSVKRPDARRGCIFLRSLQPGHLTLVGIRTSGPYRVYLCGARGGPRARRRRRRSLPAAGAMVAQLLLLSLPVQLLQAVQSQSMLERFQVHRPASSTWKRTQ